MKKRRGEVWMYEVGGSSAGWAVAVVIGPSCYDAVDGSLMHECIQLAGDDEHYPDVGRVTWHEYSTWETHPKFTRLA